MLNSNQRNIRLLIILPFSFVLLLTFIIYSKEVDLSGLYFSLWTGKVHDLDYFAYYRSLLDAIIGVFSLVFIFLHYKDTHDQFRFNWLHFPLFAFSGFVVLSTVLSDYLYFSILGFVERYEGAPALIAYILLTISASLIVRRYIDISILFITALITSSIISILGILQFFGLNYLANPLIQRLILPSDLHDLIGNITFQDHVVFSTLYNPNNVGVYMAMLFPFSFALFMLSKKKSARIILAIHSCLIFATWIGSRSRASVLAIGTAFLILLFGLCHTILTHRRRLLIVIPYILIFIIMNSFSGGGLLSKYLTISPQVEQAIADERARIEDIQMDDTTLIIDTKDSWLQIEWTEDQISFFDETRQFLDTKVIDETNQLIDPLYEDYTYNIHKEDGYQILIINLGSIRMEYLLIDDEIYIRGTQNKVYQEIPRAESIGFANYERFGSSRGYIWSRTLPMLRDNIWIGEGPDTYSVYFPQDDLIGKLNNFGKTTILVDKPHNFYLQTIHNSGLLSLIFLLIAFIGYGVQSIRIFRKTPVDHPYRQRGIIILSMVVAYLIAVIFVDSVVYVAPTFWIFFGIGLSINQMLRHPDDVQDDDLEQALAGIRRGTDVSDNNRLDV